LGWLISIYIEKSLTGFKVKGVRVVSRCRGTKWFVVITIQADVSVPDTPSYGRAIGVDVGLNDFWQHQMG
jgi:putative transposase